MDLEANCLTLSVHLAKHHYMTQKSTYSTNATVYRDKINI